MKKLSVLKNSLVALGIAVVTATASATPIIGVANMSFGQVAVSAGEVDWNPPLNPGVDATRTYGSFSTFGPANTGSFNTPAFSGLTGGIVQDLSNNPGDANFFPVNTPSFVPGFMNFGAQTGWQFDATWLYQGLAGTPFLLTPSGGGVSATISASGFACDTEGDNVCDLGDDRTKFSAIFSAQYTNTTIAQLQQRLIAGETLANNTWSGTLEASIIPEPTSISLFGLALAGFGLVRRRKA